MKKNYDRVLFNLVEQYKGANRIEYVDLTNDILLKNFFDWLKIRKFHDGGNYKALLKQFSIGIGESDIVEIGKNYFDTLVPLESNTVIATPDIMDFPNDDKRVIIDGKLRVIDGIPYIEKGLKKTNYEFDTYLTHNPATKKEMDEFRKIHNNGTNMCLGFFGGVSDGDRKVKLEYLKKLRDSLIGKENIFYDVGTFNDTYYGVVGTNNFSDYSIDDVQVKVKKNKR